MLPYASIMSTSSRFRCLGAPNASVLAKFFNQRLGIIPAAIDAYRAATCGVLSIAKPWLAHQALHLMICQRISESFAREIQRIFGWASTQPNPKRNPQKLDEKPPNSVRDFEPGLSPPLPSFSILPPSDSKTPARWVEIVPEHWSGYAAAWWSERSAWLLDDQAMSSHIRTTTGPNFYNSWCIAMGFGWGKAVLEVSWIIIEGVGHHWARLSIPSTQLWAQWGNYPSSWATRWIARIQYKAWFADCHMHIQWLYNLPSAGPQPQSHAIIPFTGDTPIS